MTTPTSPAEITATLEARYPTIGERAQQAARLYAAGEVHPLPKTPMLKDDRWKVLGYTTSIAGKYCTCPDADETNAPRHNGGPLCAHRIAAMMRERLGQPVTDEKPEADEATPTERLRAIFTQATELSAPQVRLRVRVDCTWNRKTEQGNTCIGYLLAGEDRVWVKLYEPGEYTEVNAHLPVSFSFTLSELQTAMDAEGWQFGIKNRSSGGDPCGSWINEIWYVVPQQEEDKKYRPELRTRIGAVAA